MRTWRLLILSAALTVAPLFSAAFTEPPDFSNSDIFTLLGNLELGSNTVTGSVNGLSLFALDDFRDTFLVSLPTGMVVTAMRLVVTNFSYGAGAFQVAGRVSLTDVLNDVLITGDGTYNLPLPALTSFGAGIAPPQSQTQQIVTPPSLTDIFAGRFDYQMQYDVAAVPEPATALLLMPAAWVVLRRKKQTHNATS